MSWYLDFYGSLSAEERAEADAAASAAWDAERSRLATASPDGGPYRGPHSPYLTGQALHAWQRKLEDLARRKAGEEEDEESS